jgi:DNA-binding NarL/FixJ family response regulator
MAQKLRLIPVAHPTSSHLRIGQIAMVQYEAWSESLSPREHQVALLVARGWSNKQVARELGLSTGTVKIHLHSVFRKLGAKRRYGLIGRSYSLEAAE